MKFFSMINDIPGFVKTLPAKFSGAYLRRDRHTLYQDHHGRRSPRAGPPGRRSDRMFVVLTIQREEKGLLARAGEFFGRGPLEVRRRTFLGNGYYHITDHTGGRPHWEQVARAVGRAATRLVMAGEEEPPQGSGLRVYDPSVFAGRLTAMAGVRMLGELGDEGRRAVIGMVDEDGLFTWCAGELARWCGLVRVYTRRPDRYRGLCRELMEGLGASLALAEEPRELEGCRFAVSPAPTGVWKLPLPVVTVDHSGIQGRPVINRLEPMLSPELEEEIPAGVNKARFLGAVWETGLRKFPLEMGFRACRVDGRLVEGLPAV